MKKENLTQKKIGGKYISIFLIDMGQKVMTPSFFLASLIIAVGIYLGTIGYGMDSCFDLLVNSMPAMNDFAVFDLVAASFVSAVFFCKDYHSGEFSLKLFREGVHNYVYFQLLSCSLSAGLVSVLARVWILGILLLQGHPFFLSEFEVENNLSPDIFYYDRCVQQGNMVSAFFVVLFSVFLFNAVCALAGMAFSAWFPNSYVAYFSPYIFLLMYKILMYHVKQEYRLDFIGQAGSVSSSVFINIVYAVSIALLHVGCLAIIFYSGVKRRVENGQLQG